MQGRHHIALLGLIAGLLSTGCTEQPPSDDQPDDPPPLIGTHFEPATVGTIQGTVDWTGALPVVPPFPVRPVLDDPPGLGPTRPNPHAPLIEPRSRAVANAVVFLRGVEPDRSRLWDHPPVRVVLRGYRIDVCQGDRCGQVGFVRRGDPIEMVSTEPVFDSLQADGAAFWTLPFPDPDRPLTRQLSQAGLVELRSGAGFFWMHGTLFVVEHSYYVVTDTEGRFRLPQVPPGQYDLVCWLPSYHVQRHARDPETMRFSRLVFRPPVEVVQTVTVETAQTRTVTVHLDAESFSR